MRLEGQVDPHWIHLDNSTERPVKNMKSNPTPRIEERDSLLSPASDFYTIHPFAVRSPSSFLR